MGRVSKTSGRKELIQHLSNLYSIRCSCPSKMKISMRYLCFDRGRDRDSPRERVYDIQRSASPHTIRIVSVLVQFIKVTSITQFSIVKLYKRDYIHKHFQKRTKICMILHTYNKSWCVCCGYLCCFLNHSLCPVLSVELSCSGMSGKGPDK